MGRSRRRAEASAYGTAGTSMGPPPRVSGWYNSHIRCASASILEKSRRLKANPRRGIGFEEARELFSRAYWLDQRSDVAEQFLAIGWVGGRLYSVIFEVREDEVGEILHLVTLWRSTKEEIRLYEENRSEEHTSELQS